MNARVFALTFFYFTACSRRGVSMSSVNRIINGSSTDIQSVPYVLAMMCDGKYMCCAAIINEEWAVTAAHCVKVAIDGGYEISVRSGSSFFYRSGLVHYVNEIVMHENYDDESNDYDIAVIKVTPPFTNNIFAKPVKLAPDNVERISKEWGTICGWGYSTVYEKIIDDALPKRLQCIKVPLIEKKECEDDYKDRYLLTPRMTCYGFQDGTADSCKGDSGGPLVNEDNVLIGITSWGEGCSQKYSPGVYTDIIYLRKWIEENAN